MKKLIATVLTVLACGGLYALPVGNPSDASLLCDGFFWEGHCGDFCDPCLSWCNAWSIRIGFYGDYVYNRHMEIDRNEDDAVIEHTELYTNAGFAAINFWDRVDIFATFGATNIFIDTNSKVFGSISGLNRLIIETETDFSWSVGVRGTLWECGCLTLGAEAQYFYTHPDIRRVTIRATDTVYPDGTLDAKYQEWQFGIGISHRTNFLVPYIAIKWAHAQLELDESRPDPNSIAFQDIILYDLENQKGFGYAIGVSLVDCEKASVTVEGRYADEKALYVNGQIRF